MNSPARKQQAESEFDDLLGHLVDELAMTPPSESAVSLIPDPPKARVDSTQQMAAEAAAAAAQAVPAAKPDNTVKIVGILAGSLTAVAVAALLVFGGGFGEAPEAAPVADDGAAEQLAVAEAAAAAAQDALKTAVDSKRLEIEAEAKADADAIAKAKTEAEARAAAEAEAKKKNKTRRRSKPKSKSKSNSGGPAGMDFDDL